MKNLKSYIKENDLIFPDYNDINVVDVVNCLYAKCGYVNKNSDKVLKLNKIIPDNKHYLFIVSDGTGINIINKLEDNTILRKNLKKEISTVFPSTTGCVLTSLVTGVYPEEHGIWGWFNYNRSLNRNYYPVLFCDRVSNKSLEELNINSKMIFKKQSILKKLKTKVNVLFPDYICDSIYSKFVAYDKDRYSYKNFSDIIKLINSIAENDEPSFTYLYLPDIDSIEHEKGVYSSDTINRLKEIDNLLEKIIEIRDFTVVFTADHGQTEIMEDIILDFNKYTKYFYALPSIDFGTASYYIKDKFKDEFVKTFENDFKDKMCLFETKNFINGKFFGLGNISNYAYNNLGEYISLCKTGKYLINTEDTLSYLGKIKGNHSGLTKDEMIVPLIVIDTNNL